MISCGKLSKPRIPVSHRHKKVALHVTNAPLYPSKTSDQRLAEVETNIIPLLLKWIRAITVLTSTASDLVYGNHLSAERTPPAHHRGIFQRLSKAKSNISRGARGRGEMSPPWLFVCSKKKKNTKGCLWLRIESGSRVLY